MRQVTGTFKRKISSAIIGPLSTRAHDYDRDNNGMRAGPILILLLKWIAIPLALVGIGFYLIGPRIGQTEVVKSATGTAAPDTQPDAASGTKVARHGEPKVEVSAVPLGSSGRSRRRSRDLTGSGGISSSSSHRRHRRRNYTPSNPEFDTGAPQGGQDGGGSTGGGDGGGGMGFLLTPTRSG